MVYSWGDIIPSEGTLMVFAQVFGILLGFIVSLAVGAIVSIVYSSVILVLLVAPVVGGMTAGCFHGETYQWPYSTGSV